MSNHNSYICGDINRISSDNELIQEIKCEYEKINNDWLVLHYKATLFLAIVAFLIECVMSPLLIRLGVLTTSVEKYILKFIVVPSCADFLCLAAAMLVMKTRRLSNKQKNYIISLIFVLISTILFTVHNIFYATYSMFAVAIILTTIYVDYYLTFITSLFCIFSLVFSELFIKWDLDRTTIYEDSFRLGNFLIAIFVLIACFMICLVGIYYGRKKNETSIRKEIDRQFLEKKLCTDDLTGVYNRRALHDALRDMETCDDNEEYIFVIADIDRFKRVNDGHGHQVGDFILMGFAQILNEYSEGARVFRYGGDEFCLLFHNTAMKRAVAICENIRLKMNALHYSEHPMLRLTVSMGLAAYSRHINTAQLFVRADQTLYLAKEVRNTIRIYDEDVQSKTVYKDLSMQNE